MGSGNANALTLQAETITLERGAGIYSSSLGLSEFSLPDLPGQPSGSAYLNSLSPEGRSAVLVSLVEFALQESLGDSGVVLGELLLSSLPTDAAARSRRLLSVFRRFAPEGSLGGDGGNLSIQANQLEVTGGSRIAADTFSAGSSGQMQIQADRIQVSGTSSEEDVPSAIRLSTQGSGSSQSLMLSSNQLQLLDRALVSAATSNGGTGGDVVIDAQQIQLNRDATITASATASGAAGRIDIQTAELDLANGSQIQTNTEGPERAGDLRINASDRLSLSGPDSGLFARTGPGSIGQGGNLNITAPDIRLDNSASIAVDSQGQGQGGSVTLRAGTLVLGTDSSISAETASSQGGNIQIAAALNLRLAQESLISATAGQRLQGGGDGGNIAIATPFLIALPDQNSDIIANAFSGQGGNIAIDSEGIFNLQLNDSGDFSRLRRNQTNDISASSQFGSSGTLNLNGINVDPSQGLAELPSGLVDPAEIVARRCAAQNRSGRSSLVLSGPSGLPSRPGSGLGSRYNLGEVRSLSSALATRAQSGAMATATAMTAAMEQPLHLREAGGWQRSARGNIRLVGESRVPSPSLDC